jgi:hypothetical protein
VGKGDMGKGDILMDCTLGVRQRNRGQQVVKNG